MTWDPLVALRLRSPTAVNIVTVAAADVGHADDACPTYLAFKIRRGVTAADWQLSYGLPFILGTIRELIQAAHASDDDLGTHSALTHFLDARLRSYPDLHRAAIPYVRAAVENYLDAHETLEADIGPLSLRGTDPMAGTSDRQLSAWGLVYETEDGTREFRRFRMGSARWPQEDQDMRFAIHAAHVLGSQRGTPPERIRIAEVGLGDGSARVVLDTTPTDARLDFRTRVAPRIHEFIDSNTRRPGFLCGSNCKSAGCCTALSSTPGVLGQPSKGIATRSVSASDLRMHDTCPTQYFLAKIVHVPRDYGNNTDAQLRGELVHAWLKHMHASGTACTLDSLLPPDDPAAVTTPLSADEYRIAYPYLLWHVQSCPLAAPGIRFASADEPLYGFDSDADVVVVSKPDLVYIDDGTLVVRETKTTDRPLPPDGASAFDVYFDVPWLLTLAAGGLGSGSSTSDARVELEILSPGAATTFTWHATNAPVLAMARGEVSRRVEGWHDDDEWIATPGPHCGWCPVARWCPDALSSPSAVPPADADDESEDEPDF